MHLSGVKIFMDIDASLKGLSENPSSSPDDFDAAYFAAISALGDKPEQLDAFIRQLKALCFARAIDYSKYKYRGGILAPKKKSGLPFPIKPNPPNAGVGRPKTSIDIMGITQKYRDKIPFLSFTAFRLNCEDNGAPERLFVLYSECLNEDWVLKTFRPDGTHQFSDFQIKMLAPGCSWVLLCLFHSSDRNIVDKLTDLVSGTQELRVLSLSDLENGEDSYWKKDRKHLFNGTIPDKPSLLIHDLLDAEQECLIKDFFGSNAGFLVCSDLKGGFSGARVILVAPNIGLGDPRKYVVKVCEKSKSKLKQEFDHFQNLVAPFWIPDQFLAAEFKESLHYQALRYPFASKDTILQSTSFTSRYSSTTDVEALQAIVKSVFDHSLCQKWRERCRKRATTVTNAFAPILNISDSMNSLEELLSPVFSSASVIDKAQLAKVLNAEVEFIECPNHGDLHSDNIQVQDESNEVFLIDFGLTATYPAGLDYAALEASIRFKLLDYSVDPKILFPLDAEPLSKFDNLIRVGEPAKGVVDKAQKLCSMVRERFLNDFSDKGMSIPELKVQYLCCLLILCLRQIKYPNMNRRYILQIISQILPPLYNELIA